MPRKRIPMNDVAPALRDKLFVRASFDDGAFVQDDDALGETHGREAM